MSKTGTKTRTSGRLILITAGISSVNREKLERLRLLPQWQRLKRDLPNAAEGLHRSWTEQDPPKNISKFRAAYVKAISRFHLADEIDKPRANEVNVFSGEMTSLQFLKPGPKDRVVFLLSDSPEGIICGLLVQDLLKQQSLYPELRIIKGLQADNFADFYQNGLDDFFRAIAEYAQKTPKAAGVLNVTGGFRSLIPFATYAALAHNLQLVFSFEGQPDPIAVDPGRWSKSVKKKAEGFQALLRQYPNLMRARIRRPGPIRILFLSTGPDDTIRRRAEKEIRSIDRVLRTAKFRDTFHIETQFAVRIADLQEFLLRYDPDIVHLSGHASRLGEFSLMDDAGDSRTVSIPALGGLFATLKDNIECVVLSASYSQQQAENIAEHVGCVIGMSGVIGEAAVSFSRAFYRALGYGKDVDTAFKLGRGEIHLEGLRKQNRPQLFAPNVDPSKVIFAFEED